MAPLTVVGQSLPRVDGPEKVTGVARYATDVIQPGMLHARLVLSPYAHARILAIDTASALAVPGVHAVITAGDLTMHGRGRPRAHAPLARETVAFCGQPVAVVLAEDEGRAEEAAQLVQVDYAELPSVLEAELALEPGSAPVNGEGAGPDNEAAMHGTDVAAAGVAGEGKSPNLASSAHFERGDVARGFAEADVVLERTYRTATVHQSYIEPHATLATADQVGQVTIWTSTQALFRVREETAIALGLPQNRVRVVPMMVGGAFGGKTLLIEPLVAALAMKVRRPVRLVMTRMDEMLAGTPAPETIIRLKVGARRDGTLTAIESEVIHNAGAFAGSPVASSCLVIGGYYRCPNIKIDGIEVLTHRVSVGSYRAPGAPQGTFAIESHLDQLARELGRDPLELRLQNMAGEGDPMPSGTRWTRLGTRDCLERLRDHPLWQQRHHDRGAGLAVGYGIAIGAWAGALEPAAATCNIDSDGAIQLTVGAMDISGTFTGFTQMAAEILGVPVGSVRVANVDSDVAPYAGASVGSKITRTVGAAVVRAAEDARDQLLRIAAERLETSAEDLLIEDGIVHVRGVPDRSISVAELVRLTTGRSNYAPVFGRGGSAITSAAPGSAAHLARVEVDVETGRIRVTDYVAVQDVGRAINPAEVVGQIQGGVTQGLGMALYEAMVYDADGRLLSGSFLDYALPTFETQPRFDVQLLEIPGSDGPFGAKGVGEPPIVPVLAAVANAVEDATGVRVTETPISSERFFAASRQNGLK